MIVSQYFVEFILYSFLGWVWESIYCTVKEKKWADRGFLFGPICPIYGSCVVGASLVLVIFPRLSDPDFPVWILFILCYIGSAIAEFGTSWVLEKRFHARWWDYSKMPLNIQGRICVPVSCTFGIAGVLIIKYLLPLIAFARGLIPPLIYELLALCFAILFGADFAMTEVSLSQLLEEVEKIHAEFNEKAQERYDKVAEIPENIKNRIERSRAFIERSNVNQKRIVDNIKSFTPLLNSSSEHNRGRELVLDSLKTALRDHRDHSRK
ncbi:putative ABC transporter permease [Butyrivibrio sp. XPD2002]|jgi:uncharacterized membrane protein|uniref:putative ABC transporter permease n=1 Tax=Butyrivibrio sp. XPD2002 TaxID=1280665 RepID=UPI00041A6E7A|nr:putative ABC transporter permease [Butyrivibrio sp. XPD2002]